MIDNQIYSEEGRAKRASRGSYLFIALLSGVLALAAAYASHTYFFYPHLTPYQRLYYPQFRASFFRRMVVFKKESPYTLLTYKITDPKTKKATEYLWTEKEIEFLLDDDEHIQFDSQGRPLFQVLVNQTSPPRTSYFAPQMRNNAEVYGLLRNSVYQSDYYELFYWPLGLGAFVFLISVIAGNALVTGSIRRKLKGVVKRGMRLYSLGQYGWYARKADGVYIPVLPLAGTETGFDKMRAAVGSLTGDDGFHKLRIPRMDENKGTFLLGDTGTGKSMLIHQVIRYAREERGEPGACYDPGAEFVRSHYIEGRDYILNPLDERFPNWELRDEIRTMADLDLIAESFFPARFVRDNQTKFFNQAAQEVFKLILSKRPTNQEIVSIISDAEAIDELARGTEVSHTIDPKAGPQRAGVLASLAAISKVLRVIPPARPGVRNFSLSSWASVKKRHSWLFFMMTSDTRDTVRPLVSAMLNILMRRMMSIPEQGRQNDAWWFIADELHTLNTLSCLPDFVAECRKHGIRYVMGTQSKFQLLPQYGEEARMILAQAKLKIFYRCNEEAGAHWVSQSIGSQEITRAQISESVPLGGQGRNSSNYTNVTEPRVLYTKDQIMSMPDLHAIWKFNDVIVPFRIPLREWEAVNDGFIHREVAPPAAAARPAKVLQNEGRPADSQQPKSQPTRAVETDLTPEFRSTAGAGEKATRARKKPPVKKSTETSPQEEKAEKYSNEIRLDF